MPSKGDIGGAKWKIKLQIMLMIIFILLIWTNIDLESVLRKGAELVKRKGIKCLSY